MNDTFFELVWAIIWFVLSIATLGYYLMMEVSLGIIIVLVVAIIFWAINILITGINLDERMSKEKNNG